MRRVVLAVSGALAAATPARAQEIFSAYSSFDADKKCKHTPGREVEDCGVCHVGYIDARSEGANEAARKLADEKARGFKCGIDNLNKD